MTTLLVVDDSAVDRRLVGGLLAKSSNYSVIYAANGKEALDQIELHVPDLVLTDLEMPEMNGLELVAAVKREYRLTPIMLMTAKGSEETAVQALQQGAASYVSKRRLAEDLVDTVERVLSASGEDRSHARLMNRMASSLQSFELESDLSLIRSLANYLKQGLAQMRLCESGERVRVCIALEEALLNAFYHGNLEISSELREADHDAYYDLATQRSQESPYRERRIYVSANLSRLEARYVIRDDGPGFDPSQVADPRNPDNLDRPCGRGLLLMRTFMDEITFNAKGNEVTLIKRRVPAVQDVVEEEETEISLNLFDADMEGETLIVSLTSNISSFADSELRRELQELVEQLRRPEVTNLIIDFGHVPYFGSTMLEAVLTLGKEVQDRGKMALCNVSKVGLEILKYAKFDTLWPILETRQDAIASVRD